MQVNLSVFGAYGEQPIAERLVRALAAATGASITAREWPSVPCVTVLTN
jgi:hypothetical protein